MGPTPPSDERSTRSADAPMSPARTFRKAVPEPSSSSSVSDEAGAEPDADRSTSQVDADITTATENEAANEHDSDEPVGHDECNAEKEELDPWGRPFIIKRSKPIVPESGHPHYPAHDPDYRFTRTLPAKQSGELDGENASVSTSNTFMSKSSTVRKESLLLIDRKYEQWSDLWVCDEDDEALEMLDEVLEAYEEFHGVGSVQVAEVCMRIGDVLYRQSKIPREQATGEEISNPRLSVLSEAKSAGAKAVYRRSIETYKNSLGDQHSVLIDSYIAVGPYPELSIHNETSNQHQEASEARNYRGSHAMTEVELTEYLTGQGYDAGQVSNALQQAKDDALRAGGHFDGPDPYADMNNSDLKLEILKWRLKLVEKFMREESYDEAHDIQLEVLTCYEDTLGGKDTVTADALVKLGEIKYRQGDLRGADDDWERALEMFKNMAAGEYQAAAARVYGNLGAAALKLERYKEAEHLHSKALEIRKTVLGPFHVRVGDSYYNLGNVALVQDDFEQARVLFGKALDIKRGSAHELELKVSGTSAGDGRLSRADGSAEATVERAMSDEMDTVVAPEEFIDGRDDDEPSDTDSQQVHLAKVYHQLGVVAGARGSFEDALQLFQKALDIHLVELGETHDEVARCYTSLGSVHQAQGDYEGAKALFRKALRIDREMHGPGSLQVGKSFYNIGAALNMQERRRESWQMLDKATRIFVRLLGEEHAYTKRVRIMLAEVHEDFFGIHRQSTIGGTVGRRGRLAMADQHD